MVSIEFHVRSSARGEEAEGSIFVRVLSRRKSASLTLPYKVYPSEWDRKKGELRLENAGKERLAYLRDMAEKLERDRLLKEIRAQNKESGSDEAVRIIPVFKMQRIKSGFSSMVDPIRGTNCTREATNCKGLPQYAERT